jgi:hypothetical protein
MQMNSPTAFAKRTLVAQGEVRLRLEKSWGDAFIWLRYSMPIITFFSSEISSTYRAGSFRPVIAGNRARGPNLVTKLSL